MAKKEWWQKMKEELDMSDLDNSRNNNKVFFGQLVFTNDRQAAQFRGFIAVMTVLFLSLCAFPAIVIAVLIQATKVCGQ